MLCLNCKQQFQPDKSLCLTCGVEGTVFCVPCGRPVPIQALLCPVCQQTQPISGAAPQTSSVPRQLPPDSQCLPSLHVPAVDAALAWSWLIDIGQGDFTVARTAAEQALQVRNANTLFARAVVHTLQGEYAQAFPLFEEAFATTQDARRLFVIASVAHLAERQRGEILPDGASLFFPEAYHRWGYHSPESVWEQRWQSLMQQVSEPHTVFEVTLLRERFMLPTYRANILSLANTQGSDSRQILAVAETNFGNLFKTARSLRLLGLLVPLLVIRGELNVLSNDATQLLVLDMLAKLIADTREINNLPGVAWLHLSRGDLLATPKGIGHPILFGYRLSDVITNTTTPTDPALFDRSKINLVDARTSYIEALRGFTAADLPRGEAMARLRLAYLDAIEGKLASASQGYLAVQRQFNAAGDLLNAQATIAGNLWVRWQSGEPGLEVEARSLANVAKVNDELAWGLSWGLAFAYAGREALLMRGNVEAALSAATMAEAVFATLDTPLRCAQTCGDRAAALQTLEETDGSATELDAALGWLTRTHGRLEDKELRAITIGAQLAQGLVQVYSGQFDAEGLERTRARARTLAAGVPAVAIADIESILEPLRSGLLAAMTALGAEKIDQIFQAVNNFAIHESLRFVEEQAAVYTPLSYGIKAIESGQDEAAEAFFQAALQAADTQTDRDFSQAMIYTGWHRFSEAREALRRYVAAGMPQPTDELRMLRTMLGSSLQNINDIEQQERIGNRELVATLFTRMKAWADARRQLDEIARIAGPLQPLSSLPTRDAIYMHFREGLIAEGLGQREQALHYFVEAANGLEARRRYLHREILRRAMGSQRTTQDIYTYWASALADTGNWVEAFSVAELVRARVLAEALGEAQAATRELHSETTFRRYREQSAVVERLTSQLALARARATSNPLDDALKQAVAALETKRVDALAELTECEASLFQIAPRWRELVAPQTEMLSPDKVAAQLPTGTLLLAYLFFSEQLLIWAVTADGLVGWCSIAEFDAQPFMASSFAARAQKWVQELASRKDEDQGGVALAQALIEPVDTLIAQAEHLLIVPFAELNIFPFQALPWRGEPLGLQKSLSYLPAASLLQYRRSPAPSAVGALVIGNPENMFLRDIPTGTTQQLASLPFARVEAQAVATIYGVQPFLGAQATRSAFQDEVTRDPKVIHLATHGYLQPGAPLASGIALAQGEVLSADELTGLQLKTDVVVLSACDTGRGTLQGSELIGLARSLIYAGARTAAVSLWQADDIATAMFMQSFHRQLHAGSSAATALREAARELCQVTARQALDFCAAALTLTASQGEEGRSLRGDLLHSIGDILKLGGDYARAADIYAQASSIFISVGRTDEAQQLQRDYRNCKMLARRASQFQDGRQIFNAIHYWAAFEIIGDWR
jgi:CHAT domain-containing protein